MENPWVSTGALSALVDTAAPSGPAWWPLTRSVASATAELDFMSLV